MEQPSIRDMVAELLELTKTNCKVKKERKHHLPRELTQEQKDAVDLAIDELEKPFTMMAILDAAKKIDPEFGNRSNGLIESIQCYLASKSGLFIRYKKS